MTELGLRQKFVETAKKYLGYKESDGSHKAIIDLYNSMTPLPRGYRVQYTDPWCATFVSAMAFEAGLLSIIPAECSCYYMVEHFKEMGRWVEDDGYIPSPGDIIFYYWSDSGKGDCLGVPDHVGIVAEVDGDNLTIIEGNISDSVGRRATKVNNRYIRGYGVPDYESLVIPERDLSDVAEWARESAERLLDAGIIHGDPDGKLRGKDNITRNEMFVALDNFLGYIGR